MSEVLSFPFISTWPECLNQHWFHHSQTLFRHSAISQEEKNLWMWLAISQTSANECSIHCSHSIEQLSFARNIPAKEIYRLLYCLKLMGFLRVHLPLPYDELIGDEIKEIRNMILCMPSQIFLNDQSALKVLNTEMHLAPHQSSN